MGVSGGIDNLLKSSNILAQLRAIQAMAVSELQRAVQTTIYDSYSPKIYHRTYDLLNSITSGDLRVTTNSIEFKVYFDPEKMRHTSLYGSSKLGVAKGAYVDIADWLNDGFSWGGIWEGTDDKFHDRSAAHFMEIAIAKIQANIAIRVQNAIVIEVKRIYG